jgi:hypothetical protein
VCEDLRYRIRNVERAPGYFQNSIAVSSFAASTSHPHLNMADAQLYEDNFSIDKIPDGIYDRIRRIYCTSSDGTTEIILDVNTDLYPVAVLDSFSLLLASTLNLDGSKEEQDASWREQRGPSLADAWSYVCYGKIYKFDESEDSDTMSVFSVRWLQLD